MVQILNIRELLAKGFWTLLARVLGAGLMFLLTIMFARWLGAGDFGLFTLGLAIMSIFSVFSRWGTDQLILKGVGANWEDQSGLAKGYVLTAIKLVFYFGIVISLLIFAFAEEIAVNIFNKPSLAIVLFYFSLLIVPFALNFSLAEAFKGIGRPVLSSYLQSVTSPFIAIVIALGIVFFDLVSLDLILFSFTLGVIGAFVVSLVYWAKFFNDVTVVNVPFSEMLREGWPMLLISLSSLSMAWSAVVVVGILGTAEELGVYSAASRTVLVTSLLLVAINSITAPKYAKFYSSGDMRNLEKMAHNSSKILIALVVFPVGIMLAMPEWLMGLFGEEFMGGATVLMILAIGQFVNVACGSVGYILTMTGHEHDMRRVMIVTAGLNIIMSIVFMQYLGLIGIAISTTLSIVIWNLWALLLVKKRLGFWTISITVTN